MRILLTTNGMNMGGIETGLRRLSGGLVALGHTVTVAARPGSQSAEIVASGVSHLELLMQPLFPIRAVRDVSRLRKHLLEGVDVVHVFAATAGFLLWIAARTVPKTKRPPVVASIRGLTNYLDEPRWKVQLRAAMTLLGASTAVIDSQAVHALIATLPIRPPVVMGSPFGLVPPAPVPEDRQKQLRSSLGLRQTDRVVATTGRLHPVKNHDLTIRAAASAAGRAGNAHYLIVGEGDARLDLEHLIVELGVEDSVHLLGERNDIIDILSIADVYVRPGIHETFGQNVIEAMSLGLPIVSFDLQDTRTVLEHGISGLLVPPADVSALASAILQLLSDDKLALDIGQAGHDVYMEHFISDITTSALCDVYTALSPTHTR
jgi:glycosyltransferase involved in cell wall biosynthesis